MVQSYESSTPVAISCWAFLWTVVRIHISIVYLPYALPTLITRALNAVKEYGRQNSIAGMVELLPYRLFLYDLSGLASLCPGYTTTDHGKRVAASIRLHPVWIDLASHT